MSRPRKRGANKLKRIPWKIIRKHNRRRSPSSLEKKVYGWLEEDDITYRREKPIGRYLHVDIFLEPKTCIELNGCHWHRHECTYYKEVNKETLSIRNKDARRYKTLITLGYKVVVIWECECEKNPKEVRKRLRTLAGES